MNHIIILKNIGIIPELFLGISIIYLIILGSILSTYKTYPLIQNLILNLSILVLLLCLFLVFNDKLWVKETLIFNNTIAHDYLSFFSKSLILIFSTVCLIMIQYYIQDQKLNQFEYILIILLSILGFLLLCSANDFITAYLAIELQSLAFYVMSSFKKNSSFSVEAGLKYFVLGSFSSALLLFGTSLLYGTTGTLNFEDYKDLFSNVYPGKNTSDLNNGIFTSNPEIDLLNTAMLFKSDNCNITFNNFKDIYSCFNATILTNNLTEDIFIEHCKFFDESHPVTFDIFKDIALSFKYIVMAKDLIEDFLIEDLFTENSKFFNRSYPMLDNRNRNFSYQDYMLLLIDLEIMRDGNFFSTFDIMFDFKKQYLILNLLHFTSILKELYPKDPVNAGTSTDDFLFRNEFESKVLEHKKFITEQSINNSDFDNIFYKSYIKVCDNLLESDFIFSTDLQDHSFFYNHFETQLIQLGLMLVLVSLFFKLAVAPLHAWSPDVYEGSPTSSTLFFAVVSKLGVLVLLIRIFHNSFYGFVSNWRYIIVIIAVISVIIGSFTALRQKKLKSLLAYSSISHMGYLLIAFSTGTLEGVQSIFAYILIYMLAGSCIWSIFLLLRVKSFHKNKHNKDLADLSSLIKSNSVIALIFSTVLFSIAGFPPLIGFFTKMNIFLSAVESSMFLITIISILTSVVSTFYYIRIIKILCFENNIVGKLYHPLPFLQTFLVVVNFHLFIFLFINPTILYLISYKISLLGFF